MCRNVGFFGVLDQLGQRTGDLQFHIERFLQVIDLRSVRLPCSLKKSSSVSAPPPLGSRYLSAFEMRWH
jgi:hypothetical protein